MSQQQPPPPPGGYPPPPSDSPTQPGYPPPPPPPDYVPPPQPGGYYAPPPPPPGSVYTPPATPPENNSTRNVVIGGIVALLLVLILAAVYVFANRAPQPSFPVIIPTATPEATKTPKPTATEKPAQTEEAPTQKPTEAAPTVDLPTAEPSEVASGPTAEPASEPPATEPAGPSAEPSTIPGTEDQGIVIGDPVVIGDATFPQVALLVQNVDTTVKSYSLKATFKDGINITATATGYVSDHLQGTIRTPTLFIDGTPGPNDTVTVQIDTMLDEEDSTQAGDIAKQVTFGPPTITTGDFPTVDVEVTNGSDTAVGLTVDVGILRDGVLVGVGSGVVSDMSAGQTKTATLYVTGSIEETDQLLLTVSSVIVSE